jgi:Ca2+-binding EF-hand superfamily protein
LPPIEPPVVEPVVIESCKESAQIVFKEADTNGDGVVSLREFEIIGEDSGQTTFDDIDLNSDGEIEFAEVVQELCSCDNELFSNFEQLTNGDSRISMEDFSALVWVNQNNFLTMDVNDDGFIGFDELEIASLLCETTFSAFDSDGDGVVDDKDAFPEDPKESVDSDGDGVGDNADFAPSVANDLLYATGGSVLLVLAGLLLFFLKGGMGGSGLVTDTNQHWDEDRHNAMQDEMLGMNESIDKELPQLDGIDSANQFAEPMEPVVSTPFGEQPTSFEPRTSAAQNTAASEASSELLGNNSQQAPRNMNNISEVLDDLFD